MAGVKISDLPAAPSAQLSDVFPVDQLPGPVTYKESNQQLLSLFQVNGQALTKTDDTNVTMTLGGSPTIALLNATSMTLGWAGQLSVPRGGTGNSTFTAYSVICAGTTATGAFQNVSGLGSPGQQLTSNGPGALPSWQASSPVSPAALTKVDDTNVTLTLGGSPNTALLQATSITAGWTGTLAETRGGTAQSTYTTGDILYASAANTLSKLAGNITTNTQYLSQTGSGAASAAPVWTTVSGTDITGAALTKTDDTNVTMTLGGTPATALLRSASMTLGWTGQLSVPRGGTGLASATAYAVLCGGTTSTGAFQSVASVGSAGEVLTSNGAGALPSFQSGTGFPSGTVMLFVQTSAPTGWTKNVSTNDNSALRVVTGTAGTGGSVAFTTAFASQAVTGSNSGYTLTTPDIPAHTHSYTGVATAPNLTSGVTPVTLQNNNAATSGSTGGGGSHTHTFTGTAINMAVLYVDVIQASKN